MANYLVLMISFCLFQASLIQSGKQNLNLVNQMVSMVGKDSPAAQNSSQENLVNFCTCGVFLSGQFVKGSSKPPVGYPPITRDIDDQVNCASVIGLKQCLNRCVESLITFMPKSADLICASIDRDCFKERAFLFVNNCNQGWYNTKFSAGRDYCCKDGEYYKCPV